MMAKGICFFAFVVLAPACAQAQEVRGAWMATDSMSSKTAIAQTMDTLASNNFNIVYVDAWTAGYPSEYLRQRRVRVSIA